MAPRPIDTDEKPREKKISILELVPKECSKCYYEHACTQAHISDHCTLINPSDVSIGDAAAIQHLQEVLVRDAVVTLQKHEALYRLGLLDDADALNSLRIKTFELLEKLKRTAGSAATTRSAADLLRIPNNGKH